MIICQTFINVLVSFLCLFSIGSSCFAQINERLRFYAETGLCRRVNYIDGLSSPTQTIPLIWWRSSAEQRNRYDAVSTSFGSEIDVRKTPNKGLAVGLEFNHIFSSSDLEWRTEGASDLLYLKSFQQHLSMFSFGLNVLQRGILFKRPKFHICYHVGLQANVRVGEKVHFREIRIVQTDVNNTDLVISSELVESNVFHRTYLWWITLPTAIHFNFETDQNAWGFFLFNNRFGGSPMRFSTTQGVWDYSDETGIGFTWGF